jgi:N-formylglutamate amidohydrolase
MTEETSDTFEILAPARWTAPIVFNSPHSGGHLPPSFLAQSCLTADQLHVSEDTHIDRLFMGCLQEGAPLLRALVSRSYLDLNREPFEFDSRMFDERLPNYMNVTSPRVASGLGTIPKTVGDGIKIYPGTIALSDAMSRVETYYRPYHRTLAALLDEAFHATGEVLLVDCHSMPSSAVPARTPDSACDVVLGDRFGSACDGELVSLVEHHFAAHGLKTMRNRPYAGGYFTEIHGRPREGRYAIQIEINRAIYMDERTRLPSEDFQALRTCLDSLCAKLADHLTRPAALAAE